ncbi:MAG: hypothetical protein IT236_06610 [Bacteroidia bacterium]|nr:hypothetical protein [Bacteroidia bacterium]
MIIQNNQLSSLLTKIAEKEAVTDFLVTLHGHFNQDVVMATVKLIEDKCVELNYSSSLTTRIKMVSVEILQNISKHQHLSDEVLPYFVMGTIPNGVSIYSGNMVTNAAKNLISDRLTVYSGFDRDQLKSFYRDSLKNTHISETGNAGIGLLDIVYRSNQQVEFSFHDYNSELYYFGLNVSIKNNK